MRNFLGDLAELFIVFAVILVLGACFIVAAGLLTGRGSQDRIDSFKQHCVEARPRSPWRR